MNYEKLKIIKQCAVLVLIFIFIPSQILFFALITKANVSLSSPQAGSCTQNSGTTASGAQSTIYPIGVIQITLTASEVSPGQDDQSTNSVTTGNARGTNMGNISQNGDVIGNVVSIIPPTGTSFVILSGKENSNDSSQLTPTNVTINNAISQDASSQADSNLGISVGLVSAGTAGVGRVIVAIARDADGTSNETYPKSGSGNNTVTITIDGLGLSIPPSGNGSLSGTLQATLVASPPSGIGMSGGVGSPTVISAIPGFNGTFNICTISSTSNDSLSCSISTPPPNNPTVTVIPNSISCTRYTATDMSGVTRTVYPVGTIKITTTPSNLVPAQDDQATGSMTTGNAKANNNGNISLDGSVIGNVFSLIPPSGTKFVVVPGFEDITNASQISQSNVTIENAFSKDSKTNAESYIGVSAGVVSQGTAGGGRAIVAIARDADSTGTTAGSETYPKSGTGSCTATININGLALVNTSSTDDTLSGTLSTTIDQSPPSGIGMSGGIDGNINSAFPGIGGTSVQLCSLQAISSTSSSSSGSSGSSSSSSSSGSLSSSSSSSSSGLISSSSSSSSGSFNNCPPCLVSGSQCPINCLENLINCNGVAYLNICDYQRIKCGCGTSNNSTSSSGGTSSTSSTSSSSGATAPTPNLNPNFSGVWKGIAKITSPSGKSVSKLAVLKLCISDGELSGSVNVSGAINGGEILSQDVKSENEVDVDVADRNDDIISVNLKLVNNRRLSIGIEDTESFLARKTKVIKQCLQSLRKNKNSLVRKE